MGKIKACIFDLDGVIVDTAKYHYQAWRRLANSMGFDFSEAENEQLKGVSRMQSLDIILNIGGVEKSDEEKQELAAKKNSWYQELIDDMTSEEILPGVLDFINGIQAQGIHIALGSASKNAPRILEKIKLTHYFEVIIDGTKFTKSKPDPEVFLNGANALGIAPAHCVVFEDAPKGVQAALNGGMYAIGVGEPANLGHADLVIPGFKDVTPDLLDQLPERS